MEKFKINIILKKILIVMPSKKSSKIFTLALTYKMKNKKALAVFVAHLVVLIAIQAQNTSPVLYAPCETCDSGNHNENNHNFQYGGVREFDAEHVTSDFGPRDLGEDWHGGVDFYKCA
jgi:hypothetical protein